MGYDTATGSQSWHATYTGDPATEPLAYTTTLQVTVDGGVIVGGALGRPPEAEDAGDYITLRYNVR